MNAQSICIDNLSYKSGPACRVTFLHGSFYLALDRIRSAPPFRSLSFLYPSPGPHAHLLYMAASLGGRGRGVDQLPFLHTTRRRAMQFDEVIKRVLFADCDSGLHCGRQKQLWIDRMRAVSPDCIPIRQLKLWSGVQTQPTHAALFVLTLERCEGRGERVRDSCC